MLSYVGNFLILINIFITILLIKSTFNFRSGNFSKINKIHSLSFQQITISIILFITLILGFLFSDFSMKVVYENSHILKPTLYKITGSWGNHEGSLLMWITIMIIFSNAFLILGKKLEKEFLIETIKIQNFLILGFLVFLFFLSNPFYIILPTPSQGLGLNPILQDPALAIHPPLLYLGFVGSSIYFSSGIASLKRNYNGKVYGKIIKPWVLATWVFQSLGIIFGSIWAYYELGWGGFWFWDPVENSSLMPWLLMTALFHSILVLEKRENLYFWVIFLSVSTFLFSLAGTFLVRSGILNSVHTFANDPGKGAFILLMLLAMTIYALNCFFKKYKKEIIKFDFNSKESAILSNNWFMVFYLLTILIGTVYPIFTEALANTKVSIGPPYYNTIIAPILIPFLFLMALGPKVKWIKDTFIFSKKFILLFLTSIFINYLISKFVIKLSILSSFLIISSFFLISYTLTDFFKKFSNINLSSKISHIGFGMLIFFVVLNNSNSIEKDFNLKIGEVRQFENINLFFKSLESKKGANYKSLIGNFEITDIKKNKIYNLKPEIRFYSQPEMITYEASINTNIKNDYYVTMSNLDRSDLFNIKFYKKSLMIWIWISTFIICLGGLVRLIKI